MQPSASIPLTQFHLANLESANIQLNPNLQSESFPPDHLNENFLAPQSSARTEQSNTSPDATSSNEAEHEAIEDAAVGGSALAPLSASLLTKISMTKRSVNGKSYACEECGYSTGRRSNMLQHLKKHDEGREKFLCDECNKTFGRLKDLQRHESVHNEVERHICSVAGCQRSYKRKDGLQRHIRNFHNGMA
ncbi:hypothetical protein HDU82_001823 [Entophlyctis luteolus]|nr:hypothetical protein HDU82_001823 [Entophlyctis luteolus]